MCKLRHRGLWQTWLAVTVGSFGLMEYPAIKHKCHDPLSRALSDMKLGVPILVGGVMLGVHVIRYPKEQE